MSMVRLCMSRWLAAVRANRPRAIQLVPGALVAIQEQVRIDRIELQMVQIAVLESRSRVPGPVLRSVNTNDCSEGIERARGQRVFLRHGVPLVGRQILQRLAGKHALQLRQHGPDGRLGILPVRVGGVAVLDDRQRFVGIDETARVRHLADLPGVDIDRHQRAGTAPPARRVVNLRRPPREVAASAAGAMISALAWSVPIAATSTMAMPAGVLNIKRSPRGENALS